MHFRKAYLPATLAAVLFSGCYVQPKTTSSINYAQLTYQEAVEVSDAPRFGSDDSGPIQIEFFLEGAGEIPSGTINGSLDAKPEDYPVMFDGEKSCTLQPGTKVLVAGRPVLKNVDEEHFLIMLLEPCGAKDEDFMQGYILASSVTIDEDMEDQEEDEGFTDLDLVFDHLESGKDNGTGNDNGEGNKDDDQDGDNLVEIGCQSLGQVVLDPQGVETGLKPCRANKRNNCIVLGDDFRAQGKLVRALNRSQRRQDVVPNQLGLQVKGRSAGWIINVSSGAGAFPEKRIEGNPSGETLIPFPEFIPSNTWRSAAVSIVVQGFDNAGKKLGKECVHSIKLASPLVLDFSGKDMIETVHPALANVRFDLTGSGVKQQTGWIKPTAAFLAIDLNESGTIEDGAQLFGEATRLRNGELAKNGYEALAQYDENGDGVIDAKDPIFERLLLWFDRNMDGVAQPDELVSLAKAGVSKIAVSYEDVPAEMQNTDGMLYGNLTPYRSRFWGPSACGDKGCYSYDVFFQASNEVVQLD